ncbi:MAG: hypothetical protein U1E27_09275, partial [Kiritimatiellia bacterium]|nr:hypothetical protein [Kiritimatiellia bacterium]
MDWAGPRKFAEGRLLFERGCIQNLEIQPPFVRGSLVTGTRTLRTALKLLPDGSVESLCPCYERQERGVICPHVIALGLELHQVRNNPERQRKIEEERRHAERLNRSASGRMLRRVPRDHPLAVPARLQISLGPDWRTGWRQGLIPILVHLIVDGRCRPVSELPEDLGPLGMPAEDETILFVLEDIAEGPPTSEMNLR